LLAYGANDELDPVIVFCSNIDKLASNCGKYDVISPPEETGTSILMMLLTN
jgi:hypothetical protein